MLEIEHKGYERVKELKVLETVWIKDNAVNYRNKATKNYA
jgi:hypothetical protein